MNLIELCEEMTKRIDKGRVIKNVHMDFSKTFDRSHLVGCSERLEHMESRVSYLIDMVAED